MTVPFLEANPVIVNELRAMDHSTKEYKKLLPKVLRDIGGIVNLFKYLKEIEAGNRLRKQYNYNFLAMGGCIISLFIWFIAMVYLTGRGESFLLNAFYLVILIWFILSEIVSLFFVFFFAIRCKRTLLQGVSFLIDSYGYQNSPVSVTTLSEYKFQQSKNSKNAIATRILSFVVVFGIIILINVTLRLLFAPQTKEFSKAGMTITLTGDFAEQDIATQTSAYISSKYMVLGLKEEFEKLEMAGIYEDSPLWEYAETIIANNFIDAQVEGSDSRPYFIYSREVSEKDFTYLAMVFKGYDAFWIVTFACESKDYEASKEKFLKWADTIKVE